MLKTCYKKSISKENFFELLKDCELETYSRRGVVTGVMFCNLKFRFRRLGFSEERIEELDKTLNRRKELSASRENKKIINRNRNR